MGVDPVASPSTHVWPLAYLARMRLAISSAIHEEAILELEKTRTGIFSLDGIEESVYVWIYSLIHINGEFINE